MRISDWSSDVCSPDLPAAHRDILAPRVAVVEQRHDAAPGFLGLHEIERTQAHIAHLGITPERRAIARFGLPRLDRIGALPEGTCVARRKFLIKDRKSTRMNSSH